MINIPADVQNLFKADSIRKEFHVHFPNGELPDFANEKLVSESVKFTESLCSQQYLKFGLTESSEIEFETVGVANMLGMTIQCACEIDISSLGDAWIINQGTLTQNVLQEDDDTAVQTDSVTALEVATYLPQGLEWLDPQITYWTDGTPAYRVPYGQFVVNSCPRNHGAMTHRKVKAYSTIVGTYDYTPQQKKFWNQTVTGDHKNDTEIDPALIPAWWLMAANIPGYAETELSNTTAYPTYTTDASETSNSYIYRSDWDYDNNQQYELTIKIRTYGQIRYTNQTLYPVYGAFYKLTGDIDSSVISQINTLISTYNLTNTSPGPLGRPYKGVCVSYQVGKDNVSNNYYEESYPTSVIGLLDSTSGILDGNLLQFASVIHPILTRTYLSGGEQYTQTVLDLGQLTVQSNVQATMYYMDDTLPISGVMMSFDASSYYFDSNSNRNRFLWTEAFDLKNFADGFLEMQAAVGRSTRKGTIEYTHFDNSSPYAVARSDYSECWWDEYDVETIGQVIYKYYDEEKEEEQTTTYTFGTGQSMYDMSNNYFFQHLPSPDITTIKNMIDTYFVPNAGSINFTPLDLDMRSLPYLESGDFVTVTAEDNSTITSCILHRTISGIQSLTDSIESTNGELMSAEEV